MSFRKILLMVFACMLLFLSVASADDRSDYPDVDETAFHMTDPLDPGFSITAQLLMKRRCRTGGGMLTKCQAEAPSRLQNS